MVIITELYLDEDSAKNEKTQPKVAHHMYKASPRIITYPKVPLNEKTIHGHMEKLTSFERMEIKKYKPVWFLGLDGEKIEGKLSPANNHGYDDENGCYNVVLLDHIAYRYEALENIGDGGFGVVLKCKDHKLKTIVALKIINRTKGILFPDREVFFLKYLGTIASAYVVQELHHFFFRNHLCITFEMLGESLKEIINKESLKMAKLRRVVTSLLKFLIILNEKQIIHGDLKPANILENPRDPHNVKVVDFGGCCYSPTDKMCHTLIYSAPEVIMGKDYTPAYDMWSLGCIAAELYTGNPLFEGTTCSELTQEVTELVGSAPTFMMRCVPRSKRFEGSEDCPKTQQDKRNALALKIETEKESFLDFIMRCLEYDPKKRMTPQEGLKHRWIMEQFIHVRKV